MEHIRVDLYREFGLEKGEHVGTLVTYVPEYNPELLPKARPAALVFAGGGYSMLSSREGEPVVLRLLAEGYAVFRLEYSLRTAFPVPLIEAAMAAAYVRRNASRFGVAAEKLCVFGFSAGGHLAALLSTLFGCEEVKEALKGEASLVRPDAAVLAYPVITTDPALTHGNTARVISGEDPTLRARMSLENAVSPESVPMFLWHTMEDDFVPVENSLYMAQAYRRAGVPFELHIFERGSHGLALADGETSDGEISLGVRNVQAWLPLALAWLKLRGFSVR